MTMPIAGLPFALLAFAVGATSLQWMAELPAPQLRAGLLVAVGAGLFAAAVAARIAGRRAAPAFAAVVPGCMACALFAAGFVYAAWRADLRLGDALPPD